LGAVHDQDARVDHGQGRQDLRLAVSLDFIEKKMRFWASTPISWIGTMFGCSSHTAGFTPEVA
jgi:hypothetical protein